MAQLHKRFSDGQVIFLFQAYSQDMMSREEVQETLSISRACFFALWKEYRSDSEAFSISYQRRSPKKIPPEAEATPSLALPQSLVPFPGSTERRTHSAGSPLWKDYAYWMVHLRDRTG